MKLITKRLRKRYYFLRADAHLLSFPKCGRTWLRLMLHAVITRQYGISSRSPLQLHKLASYRRGIPCILASHDFQMVRGGVKDREIDRDKTSFRGRRVLLLVRDPRDVVVSFYYHKTLREQSYGGSISDFIRYSFDGLPTIVTYYNIWAENRQLPAEFSSYRYEDLHSNTVETLASIIRCLRIHEPPIAMLEEVVAEYEFRRMKAMEARGDLGHGHTLRPSDVENTNSFKTRSGRVGGYRDELSEEDRRFVDEYVRNHLDDYFASYKLGGN